MYCGNVVPANLYDNDNTLISQISKKLTNHLNLKGINGFDYVLKNHYPHLMEINPRIPGSISASEAALDLNILRLYIDSFERSNWDKIRNIILLSKPKYFATKLIMFAPKDINIEVLKEITNLEHVYDKTEPVMGISKNDPLCTVLYKGSSFSESYFGALKIIDKIKEIINH
jgi:predicted ATP-grasp superfamily ATP-dependent carboligase